MNPIACLFSATYRKRARIIHTTVQEVRAQLSHPRIIPISVERSGMELQRRLQEEHNIEIGLFDACALMA